jgi:predicted dehydrogenase
VNALVVGYGSIGARHNRLLTELGCHTEVVSEREVSGPVVHRDLCVAVESARPDYVVIANATNKHWETLSTLAGIGYAGTVLVEKPVFHRSMPIPPNRFRQAFVGYNLRFNPIIQRLKAAVADQRIVSAHAYVGSYLPEWRPTSDYRESYSASAERGGGVLRDLSHELDYLTWILGQWHRVSAVGGHMSDLEIDSDDVFALMFVTERVPIATIQLTYLDRIGHRFIIVNTEDQTIEADLIKGTMIIDSETETFVTQRDDSYRAMHHAALRGDLGTLCQLDHALDTVRLIEAAEQAAERGSWVKR